MTSFGFTFKRLTLIGGALGGIGLAAALLSFRAGRPGGYVVGCSIAVGCLVAGAVLARRRLVISLTIVSATPILAFPFAGSLETGPLGYTNASGALALIACAAALMLAVKSNGSLRLIAFGWALLIAAVPFAYGARTAAAGAVLLVLTAFLAHRIVRGRVLGGVAVLFLCAVIGMTLYLGATYQEGERTGAAEQIADATLGPLRQQLWHEALALVQSEPLLGVGPDRFADLAPTAQFRDDALWAHNEFLQAAAELGVPVASLLLFVFLLPLWPQRRGTQAASPIMVVAVAMLGMNAAVDFVLHDPVVLAATGLLVGASIRRAAPAGDERETGPPPLASTLRGRTPAAAALVLWLLLALPVPGLAPEYRRANGVSLDAAGASFTAPGELRSVEPPIATYERVVDGSGFTVEGWFQPYRLDQEGPARLVTSSAGIIHRNFTLGQDGTALEFRLRTTGTDWNARQGRLVVDGVFTDTSLRHVAVVYDGARLSAYVDGRLSGTGPAPTGDFSSWVFTYPLLLGNEDGGERPWEGRIARVGLYDTALSVEAVASLARQIELPLTNPTAPEIEQGLVTSYDLRGGTNLISGTEAATPLERPRQVVSTPPGFRANLLGVGEDSRAGLLTALANALVAGALGLLLGLALARELGYPRSRLARATAFGLGAALLAGTATYVRHRTGAEASIWVPVAALLGATTAGVIAGRKRRPHEQPHHETEIRDVLDVSTP